MDNEIKLYLAPQRINPERWAAVWPDTLRLAQAAGLLNVGTVTLDGLDFRCAIPAEHTKGEDGFSGWRSYGDALCRADSGVRVGLCDDVREYLPPYPTNDCGIDLLAVLYSDADSHGPVFLKNIWEGIVAPTPALYLALLGIACFLCDRFPHAVLLDGDVSVGFCRRACRWAGNILGTPVTVPDTADAERLLIRADRMDLAPLTALRCASEAWLGPRGAHWGRLLRQHFDEETLRRYYTERFSILPQSLHGYMDVLREYLEEGMDLAMLCRILVVEENTCHMGPEQFLSVLLQTRLHVQGKETYDVTRTTVQQGWREDVDTGEMRLARSIGQLLGVGNPCVDAYIPLAQIRDICRRAFGDKLDVDAAIDNLLAELTEPPSLPNWLRADGISELAEAQAYDICTMAELVAWQPELSIWPPLRKKITNYIRQMRAWGERLYMEFAAKSWSVRAAQLAQRAAALPLFPAVVWQKLYRGLDDRAEVERYLCLFAINSGDEDIQDFVAAMLWQPELFKKLWEEK